MFRTTHARSAVAAATAATLALALSACAGGTAAEPDEYDPNEEVTLDFAFWGNDIRAEMYEEAIALFEQQHSNIDVRTSFLGFPEFWEKRQTEAAGGGLPDVMQFSEQYLRQYTESGLLLDLAPYLGDPIATDALPEGLLALGQIDGTTTAVATSVNAWGMFTNLDVLDAVGIAPFEGGSWEDYEAWMSAVTAAGAGNAFGGTDWTGRIQNFELQLRAEGSALFTDAGEPGFDKERLRDFWEQGAANRDGIAIPQQQLEELLPLSGFDAGRTATELTWDNFGVSYVNNLGVDPDRITLTAPPVTEPGAKDLYFKSAMLHTIAASTEHPTASAMLVDFLVNSPEVGRIFGTNRGLPASQSQLEGVELGELETQIRDYEASIADRIGDPPAVPVVGAGALEEKFRVLGTELGFGTITVDEAVDQFFSEMDVILAG